MIATADAEWDRQFRCGDRTAWICATWFRINLWRFIRKNEPESSLLMNGTMTIQVEELSAKDDNELVAFLDDLGKRSPSVLGYHFPFYRDMLSRIGVGRPIYLGARSDKGLEGVLPAFARETDEGAVVSSMPFFGPNAGVLCDLWSPGRRAEIHSALLEGFLSRARLARALSCSIYSPLHFDEFNLYDSAMPNAVIVEKFTQYLFLPETEWDSKIRYDLRHAERLGLTASSDLTPERRNEF